MEHAIHLLAEEMVLLLWDRAGSRIGGVRGDGLGDLLNGTYMSP
jgi:hypothetical protein